MRAQTFLGFDSAWTDNPRAPGAICAVRLEDGTAPVFYPPRLVRFSEALAFVDETAADYTLIALDQPTIVPNATSMRPAERVAASVISWIGGGVQPANRGKIGMFCDDSPIWSFLAALSAIEDPVAARAATSGRYLMEVFPALALPSLDPSFFARMGAPKYNPAVRRRFRPDDWRRVCATAARSFDGWGVAAAAAWCRLAGELPAPPKADQDRLDAMLCLAVAMHWRIEPAERSIMLGDTVSGYMVAPASADVRSRLIAAAERTGVPYACRTPDAPRHRLRPAALIHLLHRRAVRVDAIRRAPSAGAVLHAVRDDLACRIGVEIGHAGTEETGCVDRRSDDLVSRHVVYGVRVRRARISACKLPFCRFALSRRRATGMLRHGRRM
jgi:predicted RNase H-like nuclease